MSIPGFQGCFVDDPPNRNLRFGPARVNGQVACFTLNDCFDAAHQSALDNAWQLQGPVYTGLKNPSINGIPSCPSSEGHCYYGPTWFRQPEAPASACSGTTGFPGTPIVGGTDTIGIYEVLITGGTGATGPIGFFERYWWVIAVVLVLLLILLFYLYYYSYQAAERPYYTEDRYYA